MLRFGMFAAGLETVRHSRVQACLVAVEAGLNARRHGGAAMVHNDTPDVDHREQASVARGWNGRLEA